MATPKGLKNTPRNAYLLYRLLQLGFATREQISRLFFAELEEKSRAAKMASYLKPLRENGYINDVENRYFYATKKGQEAVFYFLDNQPNYLNGFAPLFSRIEREYVEEPVNPAHAQIGAMEHRRLIAETLMHFGEGIKTRRRTELIVEGMANLKPDQTIVFPNAVGFVEAEHKNEVKFVEEKIKRYIRFYFSGGFKGQFPTQKYARVFIVHPSQSKLESLMDYHLSLTEEDCGFTEKIHRESAHIGTNLFRYATADFNWIKASDWATHKHNKNEPLKYRGAWE